MPIYISGSDGQTTISGSNTTISGSDGTTVISGSVLSGSEGAPAFSLPVGPPSITGSYETTGSMVIVSGSDGCYELYVLLPSGSSMQWVDITSSCP